MTNEVDNTQLPKESEHVAAAAESAQVINSVDLLKPQPNVIDDNKFRSKDYGVKEQLYGHLEISDGTALGHLEDFVGGKIRDRKVEPLNRTETMILDNMRDAIKSGSVEKIQDMLKTLAENPKSVDRVLQALKAQMEKENWHNHVGWEQGQDNNGNSFIRLNMFHTDSDSKSSGGTSLTIGSDGRNSATHTDRWDSPPAPVSVGTGLQAFLTKYMPHLNSEGDPLNPTFKQHSSAEILNKK